MDLQDLPPALRLKFEQELQDYFKFDHIGRIFTDWYDYETLFLLATDNLCRVNKYRTCPGTLPPRNNLPELWKKSLYYDFDHLTWRSYN